MLDNQSFNILKYKLEQYGIRTVKSAEFKNRTFSALILARPINRNHYLYKFLQSLSIQTRFSPQLCVLKKKKKDESFRFYVFVKFFPCVSLQCRAAKADNAVGSAHGYTETFPAETHYIPWLGRLMARRSVGT